MLAKKFSRNFEKTPPKNALPFQTSEGVNSEQVEEEKPVENSADENAALLAKLLSNPDTAALIKALAKTI